jgi:hypothetical protein
MKRIVINGRIEYVDEEGHYNRENGPAVIHFNGKIMWAKIGIFTREELPAVIDGDGSRRWYKCNRYWNRIDET